MKRSKDGTTGAEQGGGLTHPMKRGGGLIRAGDILNPALIEETPGAHPPAKPTEFDNPQLSLFQNVLCNTDDERERFSNAIDLWDSVPRYSVSRQAMTKAREKDRFLENHTTTFQYRDGTYSLTISPARVTDLDGTQRDYYPSATEELVEDALRKLAIELHAGFFDKPSYRSGVVFSLYALREELEKTGHARSYQEIVLALNILSKSIIEIRGMDVKGDLLAVSPYLPSLVAVSKNRIKDDPKARWAVQFHPFVTDSIEKLTYRQINYDVMMSHSTQLARWLHKYLTLKYTFADLAKPFRVHYATIKRDSGLLGNYTRERAAIEAVVTAFKDLKDGGVISSFERNDVTGPRKKLLDVVFQIWPSVDFVKEMKAANRRLMDSRQKHPVGLAGGSGRNSVGPGGGSR